MRALDVHLHDRRAGVLEQEDNGRLRFTYSDEWLRSDGAPLSVALPTRAEPYLDDTCRPFFSGLLPEGELRRTIARRFGVSERNAFALLDAIGGECAGAVSLGPVGAPPPSAGPARPRWLTDSELAELIRELPQRPLLADPDEGIRLSLAGAQDKAPVLCEDGRIGTTAGAPPSTHILKTPIGGLDDTVANEAFCLALAGAVGLDTAMAVPRAVGNEEFLLVRRYDRVKTDAGVERVHQEDLCQALGRPPELKYQADGGPSLAECVDALRELSAAPVLDVPAFLDGVVFNLIVGNHDAHSKNYSLLHSPDGIRLAPFYDVISTRVYPGFTRKFAMKIGGEYRPDYLRARHFSRLAEEARVRPSGLLSRIADLADRVEETAPEVRRELPERWQERPVLDRVQAQIGKQLGIVREALAEARAS